MKSNDFKDFIALFAQMLREAGADDQADGWATLAHVFGVKPTANVADICKVLSSVERVNDGSGSKLAHLVRLIPAIENCFAKYSKKALFDDLKRVAIAIAPFSDVSVQAYAQAAIARLQEPPKSKPGKQQPAMPATELVEAYLQRLQSALGDEARFPEVFDSLKKDKAIKVTEAKLLARAFADLNAKSKGDALELIWLRHDSALGARARARATGGRTAA